MTDSLFALTVAILFLPLLLASRWFKTLDTGGWRAWRTPLLAGAVTGGLLHAISTHAIAIGITLTAAALYVRLTGQETEPSEGMLLGTASGDVAALVLIALRHGTSLHVAACILAGAVAGFGCTVAARAVGNTLQQFVIDVVTAFAAMSAAAVPFLAVRFLRDRQIAVAAAALIPLIVIATMLQQYRDVRAELSHEASLGLVDPADVRATAHPILRLGSGGWLDAAAHREFVRLSNKIALRKRQQRNRPDEIARLYQLEIIKLRMQVQEMTKIDRDARRIEGMRHEA